MEGESGFKYWYKDGSRVTREDRFWRERGKDSSSVREKKKSRAWRNTVREESINGYKEGGSIRSCKDCGGRGD